jgi:hypothetical protein
MPPLLSDARLCLDNWSHLLLWTWRRRNVVRGHRAPFVKTREGTNLKYLIQRSVVRSQLDLRTQTSGLTAFTLAQADIPCAVTLIRLIVSRSRHQLLLGSGYKVL